MLVNLNLNNRLSFGIGKYSSLKSIRGMKDSGDSFTFAKVNKEPGPDDKTDGTIGIFQRIKNVKTYFHNAMYMRNRAYNWQKQIEAGKLLQRESRDIYCEFLNLKSEATTNIHNKIQQIKKAKENVGIDTEVKTENGARIKFEFVDNDNQHYRATLFNKAGKIDLVYNQWDEKTYDVDTFAQFGAKTDFRKEFSFRDGELFGVQISCRDEIKDSPFENDYVWEKDFYQNDNTLTVIHKRSTGSYYDKKFIFENRAISSIKKSSDAKARFVSEYLFKNNGLTQINVESYEDVLDNKYPVKTVKTLYCEPEV